MSVRACDLGACTRHTYSSFDDNGVQPRQLDKGFNSQRTAAIWASLAPSGKATQSKPQEEKGWTLSSFACKSINSRRGRSKKLHERRSDLFFIEPRCEAR